MSTQGGSGSSPLPKFGEWDVNNPASAEGFTMIFNKARNEKKNNIGQGPESPEMENSSMKHGNFGSSSTANKGCCSIL